MITSCSPAGSNSASITIPISWSTFPPANPPADVRRSPQNLLRREEGIDPENIVVVSIMPCTAKKFEIGRDDQDGRWPDGHCPHHPGTGPDDPAAGIRFTDLPDEEFDPHWAKDPPARRSSSAPPAA